MSEDGSRELKIAFDAQPLLSGTKSGVGFHENGLVRSLIKLFPEDKFRFEYFVWKNAEQKKKVIGDYMVSNRTLENACRWFPGSVYRALWGIIPIPYCLFFGKYSDITHFFNFCIPPGVKGKKVVTVHDMAVHRHPETVRLKTKIMLKQNLKKSIERADAVIAVSEFTKREILSFYSVPEEKIYVVPNGVDSIVFHSAYTPEELNKTKDKYKISGKFFLYVGNVEPRKNLARLVDAYLSAKDKADENFPKLVLGGARGWLCEDIYEKVKAQVEEGNIIFTGYIEDADVPRLMCAAEIFCFVSLYEGFGMPVLEAMACGTPVLTSNNSALSEIAESAALQVDPFNTEEISEGLLKMYNDKEFRNQCGKAGIIQAQKYSWEYAARKLHKVYEDVLEK